MDVIKRLLKILEMESITASKFADTIGINRAAMSHYLNGRNNPSLDVLNKILDSYPSINPLWLLRGTGEMLISSTIVTNVNSKTSSSISDLFTDVPNQLDKDISVTSLIVETEEERFDDKTNILPHTHTTNTLETEKAADATLTATSPSSQPLSSEMLLDLNKTEGRSVKKIILMYSDSTFAVFEQSNSL